MSLVSNLCLVSFSGLFSLFSLSAVSNDFISLVALVSRACLVRVCLRNGFSLLVWICLVSLVFLVSLVSQLSEMQMHFCRHIYLFSNLRLCCPIFLFVLFFVRTMRRLGLSHTLFCFHGVIIRCWTQTTGMGIIKSLCEKYPWWRQWPGVTTFRCCVIHRIIFEPLQPVLGLCFTYLLLRKWRHVPLQHPLVGRGLHALWLGQHLQKLRPLQHGIVPQLQPDRLRQHQPRSRRALGQAGVVLVQRGCLGPGLQPPPWVVHVAFRCHWLHAAAAAALLKVGHRLPVCLLPCTLKDGVLFYVVVGGGGGFCYRHQQNLTVLSRAREYRFPAFGKRSVPHPVLSDWLAQTFCLTKKNVCCLMVSIKRQCAHQTTGIGHKVLLCMVRLLRENLLA